MRPRPSGRPYTRLQRFSDGVRTVNIFAYAIGGILFALIPMIIGDRLKGRSHSTTPTP